MIKESKHELNKGVVKKSPKKERIKERIYNPAHLHPSSSFLMNPTLNTLEDNTKLPRFQISFMAIQAQYPSNIFRFAFISSSSLLFFLVIMLQ